ncbi:MAG TPA: 4-(cytidine 5'-diphospho)-2-C-methyl-D-erythritol kinase [Candidatus Dormibacteraeota bacterium]|nr:4-(cytidine 5'-diphospho)-2-C-methyl-D-erythritol kinase [Candidatus Dormibacteraeota bacterium]
MSTATRLVLRAPAKLNLGLEVVGRRADGHHELRSILCSIDLADEVALRPAGEGGPLVVTGPYAADAGDAESNLALRALRALEAALGADLGLAVEVVKNIPARAGLGGGSADAAAVLRAVPGLGRGEPLLGLAAALGADVPFQVVGGLADVGGVGERLRRLPHLELWFAVAFAGDACSTAEVFGELRPDEWSDGAAVAAAADLLAAQPPAGEPVAAGALPAPDLRAALAGLPNALWHPASRLNPNLLDRLSALLALGWPSPRLTGSGGAFFTLTAGQEEAGRLAAAAAAAGFAAWACRSLPSGAPEDPDPRGGES